MIAHPKQVDGKRHRKSGWQEGCPVCQACQRAVALMDRPPYVVDNLGAIALGGAVIRQAIDDMIGGRINRGASLPMTDEAVKARGSAKYFLGRRGILEQFMTACGIDGNAEYIRARARKMIEQGQRTDWSSVNQP